MEGMKRMGMNREALMMIKQEWEEMMEEFSKHYQIDITLKMESPFLQYFLYVEGYICQFVLLENENGIHFIEQDNQKDSFTLPSWERECVKERMGIYLENIKRKRRIKNTLKPSTYFFKQAMEKIVPFIENRNQLEEIQEYVLENMISRYTHAEIEKKSKKIREEELGFFYYLHNTNFVLFHFIDSYFLVKEERYIYQINVYSTLEEAEKQMQESITEVIKKELDKRNIWRA